MFGYVLPSKGELKIKDYEKFKAYYCGLCLSIKKNYGTLPRFIVNYDMTFVAILLDALEKEPCELHYGNCIAHPVKKRNFIINNSALDYASFLNVALVYFKLTDDVKDDKSKLSSLSAFFLKNYFKKFPDNLKKHSNFIKEKLNELYKLEDTVDNITIDELSHPFAELTAFVLSSYPKLQDYKDTLYTLGYNLGKWIYIIDAFDDLEEDMKKGKFNAINNIFNAENLPFKEFKASIKDRIDFILVTCARGCFECLNKLPLKTNKDILYNILQLGLLEKMEKVFITPVV
ncbi:DUF5685 family protein [Clostridium pasteurianum]|uniref:Uncharacterized protein n=1 Tax=Clostridium pasteurianum BC1 TaxID=86416 RepID=R4K9B4_CLOPA|nr:DUF5685 family protein [Clostridium pasteurianum]AGK96235.1 hypothetical protein Clopa_1246 [Clostridium pasteurianum BC1]